MTLADSTTLGVARDWLRKRVDDGEHCPCCKQFAKVYRRKINSGMARSLIRIYSLSAPTFDYIHVPTMLDARSREEGKLAYWGLIEEENAVRLDKGRAGWWRITDLGRRFVLGQARVWKYARIYDGRCLGFDTMDAVTIKTRSARSSTTTNSCRVSDPCLSPTANRSDTDAPIACTGTTGRRARPSRSSTESASSSRRQTSARGGNARTKAVRASPCTDLLRTNSKISSTKPRSSAVGQSATDLQE